MTGSVVPMLLRFVIFFGAIAAYVVWSAKRAAGKPSPDIAFIKAAYEGLQGLAGPNKTVVNILPDGFEYTGSLNYNRYKVVLGSLDGRRETRVVGVPSSGRYDMGVKEYQSPR